ncbi:hypothetical protein KFE25_003216 [Diacronema lutheri]|uniref:Uncharacterized protein n=1 Tax=Diacronema lutheri TaxID=2081491 RepID=A0A8J6CE36_DIALT|nr:hypothetical protein KFE25_003216 [Diacronema lutheri]
MASWFWAEGQLDTTRQQAEAWSEDLDYMLRLSVRRRQFDWDAVAADMQHYAECIATSGVSSGAVSPADVSAQALRERWACVDAGACEFYRRRLLAPAAPSRARDAVVDAAEPERGVCGAPCNAASAVAPHSQSGAVVGPTDQHRRGAQVPSSPRAEAAPRRPTDDHVPPRAAGARADARAGATPGPEIAPTMERALDALDLDGLLAELEARHVAAG